MASLTDILTAIQNGVLALNNLLQQASGSFLNIAGQLAALQALPYKIVPFTRVLSLAAGNQSITGVGFRPRLIQFQTGITGGASWTSFGEFDGTINSCIELALNATVLASFVQPFAGIQRDNASGTNFQSFTVVSMDVDGFTLAWAKVGTPTATASITATCFR